MSDVQLKIVDGPDAGREFPVAGVLVIGRDPSAGIVLEDSEVSRRHAQVSQRSSGLAIEDLGSTNGTFVNGEQLAGERLLLGGEKVRIGTTVLEVSVPVQATKIASVIPEEPDPGATQMAPVMSPEEAERAAADAQSDRAASAEDALRHAEPEDLDDEPTYVPDPAPSAGAPGTEAPAAPEPPAPAPAPAAGPQSPAAPAPQSPAPPAPQSPAAPAPHNPPPPQPGGFQAPPPPPPPAGGPPPPLPQQSHAQPPAGYQAGPGFQVRGPGEQWALCALVPFYAIVWYYRLCKEIGEWSEGRIDVNPALSTVAVTIGSWVIVPPFISYAGTAGRIQQCQRAAGLEPTASFGAIFWRMLLLGYGYKWLTEQLNELAVRRPVQ